MSRSAFASAWRYFAGRWAVPHARVGKHALAASPYTACGVLACQVVR